MQPQTENRIVLITRRTRLEELVARFNTIDQARFYVEHLGADFADYLCEHEIYQQALEHSRAVLGRWGRLHMLDRGFLPNYVFGAKDLIVTLGQDGLVANTLKYLDGQPVMGVNPDPARWDGLLLPFKVGELEKLLPEALAGRRPTRTVIMALATLNDGQTLLAVNDFFVGVRGHGSARYVIHSGGQTECHSSSGVIVSTGLGSTGWFKSLLNGAVAIVSGLSRDRNLADPTESLRRSFWIPRNRGKTNRNRSLETAFPWDTPELYFTVREPFPSKITGLEITFGKITRQQPLVFESLMAEGGIIFSDGIEKDFLNFNSGVKATIGLAQKQGRLVV